jgi:ABC-type anion transport system duplicated permease subunit
VLNPKLIKVDSGAFGLDTTHTLNTLPIETVYPLASIVSRAVSAVPKILVIPLGINRYLPL